MSMLRSFSALLVCLLLVSHARADEKRIALLIGNQDYPAEVGALTNTHKDVRTMEEALAAVGFETLPRFDLD